MPLYSKSIQELPATADGTRICIMRKPDFNAPWDIWMPTLAPSITLLKAYQNDNVSWDDYVKQFNEEVITGRQEHVKILVDMAKTNTVTILCWEKTPEYCHRRLIVEAALLIDPMIITKIF